MKKIFALAILVCALSLNSFAGEIITGGFQCDPSVESCGSDDNGNPVDRDVQNDSTITLDRVIWQGTILAADIFIY